MDFSLPQLSALDFAFIALALLLIHVARRWMLLYALLVLPGTFLHELAHWLVAMLMGGRPSSLQIVPVRSERGWRLGSVGIRQVRWFNALPIGLAPLVLLPVAWVAIGYAAAVDAASWLHWVGLYVAVIAAASSMPSRADWSIVISKPVGIVLYLALALAAFHFWPGR